MLSFTKKEIILIQKLNTPAKAQDFLNSLSFNFEKDGETLKSPILTLRAQRAHCLEGALLGAYILSLHGFMPHILHLKATREDFDHVIAPFKIRGLWGALSKTNHAVLRFREPIYKNIRELAMSYFHEYYNPAGKKTLRSYSRPLDLSSYKPEMWITGGGAWQIAKDIDTIKHFRLISRTQEKLLRPIESVERRVAKITVHRRQRSR